MTGVHIGTMGWSYDFWKGRLYPADARPSDFLRQYSRHFDTVEVDSTFYRIPSEVAISAWKNETPDKFSFSLKFPRLITHIRMLKEAAEPTQIFLERARRLDQKLGSILLQLPPNFGTELLVSLKDFLHQLPQEMRFAVEVRNRGLLTQSLFSLLRDRNAALAIVDGILLPTVDEVTADFVYLRWEGDRRRVKGLLGQVEADRTMDIFRWSEKMKGFRDQDLEVFGYFSKYYSGYPPADVEQLLKLI